MVLVWVVPLVKEAEPLIETQRRAALEDGKPHWLFGPLSHPQDPDQDHASEPAALVGWRDVELAQQKIIAAVLEAVLPAEHVDTTARRGDLERRFGFRLKPRLVRFRVLDERLRLTSFDADGHYLLTGADFARLPPPDRVVMTENEINFLALPPLSGAIAIFGAGSGLEHLAEAAWLARCPVYYWGDIDTHGFGILNQLRARLPEARSFLMDRATLEAHRGLWGQEPAERRYAGDVSRLSAEERALFEDLVLDRLGERVRLEQERVGFGWLEAALERVERRRLPGAAVPTEPLS